MKKIFISLIILFLIISCGTYNSLDLSKLTTGMTKSQVEAVVGPPDRILAYNQTDNGLQEVLEYRTIGNEVYGLTFWNDFLTGYEFLYDDIQYIPAPSPPLYYPDYGRPIMPPPNRPNRPNRPRPPQNPRPPVTRPPTEPGLNRPDLTKPAEVPPAINRPETKPAEVNTPVVRPAPAPVTPEKAPPERQRR